MVNQLVIRTRRSLPRFGALLLGGALVASACGGSSATDDAAAAPDQDSAEPTSDFPQFVATTVGGGQLEFGSLEGQDTVLWFWAPW